MDPEEGTGGSSNGSQAGSVEWQGYRLGARILLHIARLPRIADGQTAPEGLTQSGIARRLGTNRVSITQTLRFLEDGGAVRGARGHVENARRRVKIYRLTPAGEDLVRHIREGMGPYR